MADSLAILALAAEAVQQQERESMEYEHRKFVHAANVQQYSYPEFAIRRARYEDVPALGLVERSAAEKFRTVNLDFLADGSTISPDRLVAMIQANHLLVATDKYGPIGFVGGEELDGCFHIAEVSVAQEWQGRGCGTALMASILSEIAHERAFRYITLTTFRNLVWNGPSTLR